MSINSLFNPSFLKKKLTEYKNIDSDKIKNAREIFERWNTSVDLTKEKENQQSFLKEFFEEILGYQGIAGKKDNSLWWESGSQVDGKKPDGILGFNLVSYKSETVSMKDAGDVRVVIELKDCTVNLDKNQKRKEFHGTPIEQGFSYASKVGSSCEFVIISNFKQIRLYKYGQGGGEGKYHEFLLDDLASSDEKIKEFHFLLSKDQLFTKVNNQSQIHSLDMTDRGEEIQNEFYRWYKQLREEIWDNLVELNKDKPFGRNFYLYKAQKLIDRIIFIRFCRENNALDGDSVRQALDNTFVPTKYERLKYLFLAMDKGRPEIGIAKFNGGLFAEDVELDSLNVSDDIIEKIVLLYSHDFGSDLDVNILGHIFEQSISDLEKLSNDKPAEKKKAKSNEREKHGVFYTPPFITEFIINTAIGSWINDRKAEIKAKEDSKEFWQEYGEKLKTIKILDPACGSGAFLVKVFDYLQSEWREVKKHIKTDWDYKDILRNNIYGVDINVASIGITKLSLWLKTARYCREFKEPLTALDGNIKVGNSLIDDKRVAGFYHEYEGKVVHESITIHSGLFEAGEIKKYEEQHKKSLAFKWKEEFVAVFEQGGFDVIVGNPPYVKEDKHKKAFEPLKSSAYYEGKMDLWQFFACRGLDLLKKNTYISYIAPSSWLTNHGASKTRNKIVKEAQILQYIDFDNNKVFEAADIQTMVFLLQKNITHNHDVSYSKIPLAQGKTFNERQANLAKAIQTMEYTNLKLETANCIDKTIHFVSSTIDDLLTRIESIGTYRLKENDITNGIHHHHAEVNKDRLVILGKNFKIGDGIFSITTAEKNILNLTAEELELIKPEYTTQQIDRYFADKTNTRWTIYTDSSFKSKAKIDKYPNIKKHLDKFEKVITSDNAPYGLHRARKEEFFIGEKIVSLRKCTGKPRFSFVDFNSYVSATFYVIKPSDINLKYLTGLLNSKLIAFYLKHKGKMQGSNYQIDKEPLCKIPLVITNDSKQHELITCVEKMITTHNEINAIDGKIFKLLQGDFANIVINKTIKKWSELSWNEFLQAIISQKIDMTSKQEEKWLERFEEKQADMKALKQTITRTNTEIDKMVYALYGLSEEEIGVVENLVV